MKLNNISGSAQQQELARQCRKTWGFNPVSRVVKDKTKFTRKDKFKSRYYSDGYAD